MCRQHACQRRAPQDGGLETGFLEQLVEALGWIVEKGLNSGADFVRGGRLVGHDPAGGESLFWLSGGVEK